LNETWQKYSLCKCAFLKAFQGQKVKGQVHELVNGVASSLTCLLCN